MVSASAAAAPALVEWAGLSWRSICVTPIRRTVIDPRRRLLRLLLARLRADPLRPRKWASETLPEGARDSELLRLLALRLGDWLGGWLGGWLASARAVPDGRACSSAVQVLPQQMLETARSTGAAAASLVRVALRTDRPPLLLPLLMDRRSNCSTISCTPASSSGPAADAGTASPSLLACRTAGRNRRVLWLAGEQLEGGAQSESLSPSYPVPPLQPLPLLHVR